MNPPGTPESRAIKTQQAVQAAMPPATPMPDMNDAAVRQRQRDELKNLLSRRGRAKTFLSGRAGDNSPTRQRKPLLTRA